MKKILGLLMLLISMQVYAATTGNSSSGDDPVSVELQKGEATNEDTHLRTFIPFTCVYTDGMVQLALLGEVGGFTLTVTNQVTGEQWSAINSLSLQTTTANGIYWVRIVIEDGSIYYGTYTL